MKLGYQDVSIQCVDFLYFIIRGEDGWFYTHGLCMIICSSLTLGIEAFDQEIGSDMGSSNVSSNASSVFSSRKSSKKKYVPRMKQNVKRSTSDPANKG